MHVPHGERPSWCLLHPGAQDTHHQAPRGRGPFLYNACSVIPGLFNLEHAEVYPGQQCPAVGQLRAQGVEKVALGNTLL